MFYYLLVELQLLDNKNFTINNESRNNKTFIGTDRNAIYTFKILRTSVRNITQVRTVIRTIELVKLRNRTPVTSQDNNIINK